MEQTIGVIIPAFNEEKTIGRVLAAVLSWKKADVVVVVSDGSTDRTNEVVARFGRRVRLISFRTNRGKGAALCAGVEKSLTDIILFLDADLVVLTPHDLDELLAPILENTADMTIGVHNFWGIGTFQPYNALSGQRALRRRNIQRHLAVLRAARGGVEIFINNLHKGLRVRSIVQPHVRTLRKIDKWPFFYAVWSYIKQAGEFGRAFLQTRAQ